MKNWSKRLFSAMLAAALLVSNLPPVPVLAEETESGLCEHHLTHEDCGYVEGQSACGFVCELCIQAAGETEVAEEEQLPSQEPTVEPSDPQDAKEPVTLEDKATVHAAPAVDLPDNAELFAGFVERELYDLEISTFGTAARAELNAVEQEIYDVLKAGIETVALSGGSTVFPVSGISGLKINWSNTDLGVDSIESGELLCAAFEAQFSLDDIVKALLEDCPFDLYWHDKTVGVEMRYGYSLGGYTYKGQTVWDSAVINDLTFSFPVCADYYGGNYLVTSNVARISKVKNNAAQVVAANASKSDADKMKAYKEYICDAVSYDHQAVNNSNTPYGDPWQLISVFDGNSATNVVCEGYSKAFQYLCDLSGLDCISAEGIMGGGTGAGPHMWNVVTLDGGKYLVDVTNCDDGTIGEPDLLFLVGAPYANDRYSFNCYGQMIYFYCDDLGLEETNYSGGGQLPDEEPAYIVIRDEEFWITEDMTLTENILVAEGSCVFIDEGVTVTVPAGVELNIQGYMEVYGDLIFEEGGILTITDTLYRRLSIWTGKLDVTGADLSGVPYGGVEIQLNSPAEVIGLPDDMLFASVYVYSTEEVNAALAQASRYEYLDMMVDMSFTLTNSITIPGNAELFVWQWNAEAALPSVVISSGVTVTNNGGFVVDSGRIVVEQGATLINNEYAAAGDYGLLLVLGEFRQNGEFYGVYYEESMSQAELDAELQYIAENGNGWIHENETVIGSDMTIDLGEKAFCLSEYGSLIVSDGATLTVNSSFDTGTAYYGELECGKIIVKSGSKLVINGDLTTHETASTELILEDGAYLEVNGRIFANGSISVGKNTVVKISGEWIGTAPTNNGGTIQNVSASGICGDNLTWIYDEENWALTISGSGEMYDFAGGSRPWENHVGGARKLVIESGVASIGDHAFDGMAFMESVSIPASLKTIGSHAFYNCWGLTEVTLPEGLTKLGDYAFCSCLNIGALDIPDSVTEIGAYAFQYCTALADVTIPAGVTTIGTYAFANSGIAGALVIPDSVTSMGDYAFSACNALTSISIGKGLTELSAHAFSYCKGLSAVIVPGHIRTIGADAFRYNWLTSLTLEEGITTIGDRAFQDSLNLKEVTIPASVTAIGSSAFEYAYLDAFTFQGSAPAIAADAFLDAVATVYYPAKDPTWTADVMQNYGGRLTWVSYGGEHVHEFGTDGECVCGAIGGSCGESLTWTLTDGVLTISGSGEMDDYSYMEPAPWQESSAEITSVVVEPGVTGIGKHGLYDLQKVTSVSLPATLTSIDERGMAYMTELTTVVIPDSVKTIGSYALEGCSALTNLTIGSGVEIIGDHAFESCSSLVSVFIPAGVTSIGDYALCYLPKLAEIKVDPRNTAFCDINGVLFSKDEKTLVRVPFTYAGSYTIPGTVTAIGTGAFYNCTKLSGVMIPESVTSIGERAFYACYELPGVIIPDSVLTIADYAFNHCNTMTYVDIGDGVTTIGASAFQYCSRITDLTIGSSVQTIGNSAFSGCYGFTELTIPDSVTSIGSYAFDSCSKIKTVTLGAGLTALGDYLFRDDSSISQITFTGSAPSFERATFYGVTATAYYPADDATWTEDVRQNYVGTITWVPYEEAPATSGICGDNLTWNYGDGLLTISGTGAMYSYGTSSAPWVDYKEQIRAVSVEPGVTNAGEGAFAGMSSLIWVSLPDTVTEIAYGAFRNCTSLPEVTLPDSVTTISYNAFQNCSGLQDVKLPANVTDICYDAFADCTSLNEMVFPEKLESIEDRAFGSCANLGEMTFTGAAPTIAGNAFKDVYATAGYPAAEDSWTADVLQNYGGKITWIPYGGEHVHAFGSWFSDGDKQCRICQDCGYIEEKIATDSGRVEIGAPEQPGLEFSVDPVKPEQEEYILVEKAVADGTEGEQDVLKVFDINLKNSEGVEVQPEGTVKVKLPLDGDGKGHYRVYRVNTDGTLTDMCAYRQGSHMVFETDHFSLYVIVEEVMEYDIDGNGTIDETDAMYLIWHTLFPGEYPLKVSSADFNGDGNVTDADAVILLWYALFQDVYPL